MSAPNDATRPPETAPPQLQRAVSSVSVSAVHADGAHRLSTYRASGSAKALFPSAARRARQGAPVEAVLINTAGGLAGGDSYAATLTAGAGAALTVTTQTAERAYRSEDASARVEAALRAGAGARLEWLPQETIFFDGARLRRKLEVDLAEGASFLALEIVTLGRAAMGERVSTGFFSDFWRVRRAGRVVFADAARLSSPIDAALRSPATGRGARAFASWVALGADAERRLSPLRKAIEDASDVAGGASMVGEALTGRLLAHDPAALRRAAAEVLSVIRGGAEPPAVWRS